MSIYLLYLEYLQYPQNLHYLQYRRSLLETALYHVDVAAALEDAGTDLLDYCVRNITHLLYPIGAGISTLSTISTTTTLSTYLLHPTDEDIKDYESKDEVLEETLGQVRDMRQNIGLR